MPPTWQFRTPSPRQPSRSPSPSNNTPPGNAPPGNAPAGNPPPGTAPAGNPPPGNAPAGNPPPGNAPPGNPPPGNAPPGNPPPGNAPPGNPPPSDVPPSNAPASNAPPSGPATSSQATGSRKQVITRKARSKEARVRKHEKRKDKENDDDSDQDNSQSSKSDDSQSTNSNDDSQKSRGAENDKTADQMIEDALDDSNSSQSEDEDDDEENVDSMENCWKRLLRREPGQEHVAATYYLVSRRSYYMDKYPNIDGQNPTVDSTLRRINYELVELVWDYVDPKKKTEKEFNLQMICQAIRTLLISKEITNREFKETKFLSSVRKNAKMWKNNPKLWRDFVVGEVESLHLAEERLIRAKRGNPNAVEGRRLIEKLLKWFVQDYNDVMDDVERAEMEASDEEADKKRRKKVYNKEAKKWETFYRDASPDENYRPGKPMPTEKEMWRSRAKQKQLQGAEMRVKELSEIDKEARKVESSIRKENRKDDFEEIEF